MPGRHRVLPVGRPAHVIQRGNVVSFSSPPIQFSLLGTNVLRMFCQNEDVRSATLSTDSMAFWYCDLSTRLPSHSCTSHGKKESAVAAILRVPLLLPWGSILSALVCLSLLFFVYLGQPAAWVLWFMILATAARIIFMFSLIFAPTLAKPSPGRFIGASGTYFFGYGLAIALLMQGLGM